MYSQKKIVIIGGGISGLSAAIELEKNGYEPIIIEKTNTLGGRVKSDIVTGIVFDHGFQVLLTGYPAVKKNIDISSLQATNFLPGAIVYFNGKKYVFGDPLRNLYFLLPTLFSPLGSLTDKWKIFTLSNFVKQKTVEGIFEHPEISTLEFLKYYGFSEKIILRFFKPFYTGIFLEPDLQTSCRMFLFVFKMFSEGFATLPKAGIQAITNQLASKLKTTTVLINKEVKSINEKQVTFLDGNIIKADCIIDASGKNLTFQDTTQTKWKSCTNLYFTCTSNTINKPIIGLIADDKALINNIFFLENEIPIVSVTIVKKHNLTNDKLIEQIKKEMMQYCNIQAIDCINTKQISNALPILTTTKYLPSIEQITINKFTFLAGDYLANGSLNTAILTGELAANCVFKYLQK